MKVAKRTHKYFVNDLLFYSLVIEKAAKAHNIDPIDTVSNAYELEPWKY